MQGVFEGYGKDFATVKYNSPDYLKLNHLQAQVYQFSFAKNYHQLRDYTSMLVDSNNRVLSLPEFRKRVMPLLTEYNYNWLNTEYNAAIAGSQMASKWVRFQSTPFALLEYRTAGDARVRDEHRELNGTIRPVSDKFWDRFYPPNGWNCRCTVIRINSGEQTPDDITERRAASVAPMKGFDTNLSKTGYLFPPNSPYFIGIPDDIRKKAIENTPKRTTL